jgi:hypothetical protein
LQSRADDEHLPTTLLIARFLAPLAAAVGIVGAFRALVRALERGEWRVRRARNHVIVCGLGRKGSVLARQLAHDGMVVVGIDNGSDPHLVERCRSENVLVTSGDADDSAELTRARLAHAKCLVAVCGDDETNARIALAADELLEETSNDPQVIVHISDHEFEKLLDDVAVGGSSVEVINVYREAANAMLCASDCVFPDDVDPGEAILVAGLGSLGQEVVVGATKAWRDRHPGEKLELFVLDRRAEEKVGYLKLRNQELNEIWSFRPWTEDLTGPAFGCGKYSTPEDRSLIRVAYVCVDSEKLALTTALQLKGDLNGDLNHPKTKIRVRMPEKDGGLAALIPPDVQVFHWLDEACTPEHFKVAAWIEQQAK